MKIIGRGAIYRNEISFFWKETETAIFQGWLRRKLKTLVSKLLFWYDCWHNISNNFFNKQELKKRKKNKELNARFTGYHLNFVRARMWEMFLFLTDFTDLCSKDQEEHLRNLSDFKIENKNSQSLTYIIP